MVIDRGSVVIVSVPGDYGKPRPAVIIQRTRLTPHLDSVVVALLTTSPEGGRRVRIVVEPSETNSLEKTSRVMVDRLFTLQKHRVKQVVGIIDTGTMTRVDDALRILLDLDPIDESEPLHELENP